MDFGGSWLISDIDNTHRSFYMSDRLAMIRTFSMGQHVATCMVSRINIGTMVDHTQFVATAPQNIR